METSMQNVTKAVRFRVVSTTRPDVGIAVEITIATLDGERVLPAFFLPPDMARRLSAALEKQASQAQSAQ